MHAWVLFLWLARVITLVLRQPIRKQLYNVPHGARRAQWWERLPSTNGAQVQFLPGAICELSLLFVLALPWGFLSGFSSFSPSTKCNISKCQFDKDRGTTWKPAKVDDLASSLNNVIFSTIQLYNFMKLELWFTIYKFIAGFHMTSLKFKLQNYWSSWYYIFMLYKSSWKLIFIQTFAPNGFLVLW